MLVIYVGIVGIPMCHIFPCIILVTRDLGRILVIFYIMLSLPSLRLTMGIGYIFIGFVSHGDPRRRMFDDGARMHEYLLCTVLD
jgi:hypothetical protein